MTDFWIYLEIGFKHVLNLNAYDHVLFLIALTLPYAFKDWKRILILITVFTIGHTLSLLLSIFGVIMIKASIVEFLIPITILTTALYNIFTSGKSSKSDSLSIIGFITLFFGVIHGLGFSNYFKTLLPGNSLDKLLPSLEFALGIEFAQITTVLVVLIIAYIIQNVFRFSKRDWTLVLSAFIIGVVLPMIIQSEIWNR